MSIRGGDDAAEPGRGGEISAQLDQAEANPQVVLRRTRGRVVVVQLRRGVVPALLQPDQAGVDRATDQLQLVDKAGADPELRRAALRLQELCEEGGATAAKTSKAAYPSARLNPRRGRHHGA